MSQTIRTATPTILPAAARYSLSNVTFNTSVTELLSMGPDRTTLYGHGRAASLNVLRKSTDGGRNWTDVHTFGSSETVQGVITLANGELLVATGLSANANVYKTSGWVTNSATAAFNLKLTTRGGSFTNVWGFNQKCISTDASDGTVFISVYNGGQTSSNSTDAAQIAKARYAYLSVDFGETFALVYDVYTQPQAPLAGGCHLHAVAYDKVNERLWLTFGDSTGAAATIAGTGNSFIAYSDDWKANPTAPTWSYLPLPPVLTGDKLQVTSVLVTPNAVIFLPDPPGQFMTIFPITGYRTLGPARIGGAQRDQNAPYGKGLERAAPGLPVLVGYNNSGYFAGGKSEIRISPDDFTWYPLWRDTTATNARAFTAALYGPTTSNEIVAEYDGGIFRATLVAPTA